MLPGAQAENLLQATRALLGDYPFVFEDDGVSIMDGAEEGAFQWLTMNYLLGNLRGDLGDTVATVDLGGGSVQLAYAADAKHVAGAPEGYFKDMKSGDFTYHVYVHSHLGFGLMAERAAVLKEARGEPSPCVPAGHRGEVRLRGRDARGRGPTRRARGRRAVQGRGGQDPGRLQAVRGARAGPLQLRRRLGREPRSRRALVLPVVVPV